MQAVKFAMTDVRREIALSDVSQKPEGAGALRRLGVEPGGGNFIAALGLLCYTEVGGLLKFNHRDASGRPNAGRNFNDFFDELGPAYKTFRASHKVYDIFRCGMAHEFYVKQSCTIGIRVVSPNAGIGLDVHGKYYFAIEQYCNDLETALFALDQLLNGKSD
jgi:hypothetical protein